MKGWQLVNAVQSLIGFVPDEYASQMGNSPAVGIELPLEPGSDVIVRIRHSQIEEVRVGPSSDGYTGLQLILKPNAGYDSLRRCLRRTSRGRRSSIRRFGNACCGCGA